MSLMFALLIASSAAAAPANVPETFASERCPGIDAAQRARYAEIEAGLTRTVDAGDLESLRREVLDLFDRAERLVVAYEQGKLAHQQSAGIYTA